MNKRRNKHLRSSWGQGQLAELGPVLFIFFLLFFFPMINLMSLGVSFACGWLLNYSQAREAALIYRQGGSNITSAVPGSPGVQTVDPKKVAKVISERINKNWLNSYMGRFSKVVGNNIVTEVVPINVKIGNRDVADRIVRVNTSFQSSPFLNIPFPVPVPGLNAPFSLSFSTENTTE